MDKHTGKERFYLLVAVERLLELETLINDYEISDDSQKPLLAENILSSIRKLRKQNLKLKSYAERPVSVIGKLRGTEKAEKAGMEDIANFAKEITADSFYSRTFTIDHN